MSLDHEARGLAGDEVPWPVVRAMVLLRDEFTCAICGDYATQVDHILARVHGGSDHPLNLQATCKPCNQHKGNALPTERFEFFQHLNREQTFHLFGEMGDAVERFDAEHRLYRDRIKQLQAVEQ